jgi:hypothetical protein
VPDAHDDAGQCIFEPGGRYTNKSCEWAYHLDKRLFERAALELLKHRVSAIFEKYSIPIGSDVGAFLNNEAAIADVDALLVEFRTEWTRKKNAAPEPQVARTISLQAFLDAVVGAIY